jgi:hypothetical protein
MAMAIRVTDVKRWASIVDLICGVGRILLLDELRMVKIWTHPHRKGDWAGIFGRVYVLGWWPGTDASIGD